MPVNVPLLSLLSAVPVRTRDELLSFLAFSEREKGSRARDTNEELLVSLSFFNASALRPN